MNSKQILSELISIDTHTDKDTLEAVQWVEQYLQSYGIEIKRIYNPAKTRASLYASIGSEDNAIVFNGHLDTVPALVENWQSPPLVLTEQKDLFYGRGVCDMKGSVAASLSLVPQFIRNKANIGFLFTHDEEKAGNGCKEVLADPDVLERLAKSNGVIVMEPTSRHVVSQHKNVGSVSITINGRSAHSSNPALGIDAVAFLVKAANLFYTTLEEYKEIDNSFDVPTSTGIISKIQGGQAVNIVADTATFKCSVRFMTDRARNNFINVYCQRLRQLEKITSGLKFDIKVGSGLPALNVISEKFVNMLPFQRAKNASYYTEAGRFCENNIPAVVFGPGNIAQAHTDNEFIEKKEIEKYMNDLLRIVSLHKSR